MLLKIKFSWSLQTFPKCIRLYGGLNISRIKFLLVTPKTAKSAKISPFKIFRLYGSLTQNSSADYKTKYIALKQT